MKYLTLIAFLLSTTFLSCSYSQSDLSDMTTKWRGPNGNGIYPGEGLMTEWPDSGPEIVWAFEELGAGFSSPVPVNDKIYVNGMEGETGYVYVLDKSGQLLWKAAYGPEYSTSYPGARSSVTVAGELMYVLSGNGRLVCMNADDGEVQWSKDLFSDYDGRNTRWGITESVLVDGQVVYCTPGGREHNVIALDRFSGDLIWSSPGKGDVSAYCTPLLVELPKRKILVTMTADNILGLDAGTGELLWSHPQTNRYSVHANTPLYYEGAVFCFSGYGRGGVKLRLNEDGSSVTKEWFSEAMDSRIGGAVVVDGHIYGSGDTNREWQCIDWETGEQMYTNDEVGNGVVIYADGMLYGYSQRGELALLQPGTDGFQVTGKTKVSLGSGQHWAHPVIAEGRLYLRHGNALIAYKID